MSAADDRPVTASDGSALSPAKDRAAAVPGPLAGRRVLVPRGGEWGERVDALLAAQGADAVVVPLIRFAAPDDVGAVDAALRRLRDGRYGWLAVTSSTTVTALAGRAAALDGPSPRDPGAALRLAVGRTRVAAVGPGTARSLARHGVEPALVPTGERSARGLVAAFGEAGTAAGAAGADAAERSDAATTAVGAGAAGRRVLAPHSDIAEPTLVAGLRAAGWEVDDVVAYRTLPGPDPGGTLRADLRAGGFDAVLLSSASTVSALLELVGTPPPATLVCCIGPRTEHAAREAGLTVHVRPEHASAEDLVDALVRHAHQGGDR